MVMRVRIRGDHGAAPDPTPVFLSVCMMMGAEAEYIGDAIKSAWTVADEVVVLDTRGDAESIRAARDAHVTSESWRTVDLGDGLYAIDDFAACRNRAFELAAAEATWLLVLDADERIDMPRLREILAMLPAEVDGVTLPVDHTGRPELFAPMLKLFRRTPGLRYENRVHETVDTWMKTQCRAIADLPPECGIVRHVSAARDTRARLRRDERNMRLLEIMLREDPQSPHALGYLAQLITDTINA
jgi:hypothetical protein